MEFHFENKNSLRSQFRLLVYENDNPTTVLLANPTTAQAINVRYPSMVNSSFRGWQLLNNLTYTHKLVISDDCMNWDTYAQLKNWAELAGNQCIWLSTNKNTYQFFKGTELDFCVSYDWSFDFSSNSRTPVDEARYYMKYHPDEIDKAEKNQYYKILETALKSCLACLPYNYHAYNFVVAPIPATVSGHNKLAWVLAKYAAKILDVDMIPLTLANEKPPMKNLTINEKVDTWRRILSNSDYFSPSEETLLSLRNRNVLIVDDLYQSGASIWCLAEYLKNNLNVNIVQGATVVKAMKDSDNS